MRFSRRSKSIRLDQQTAESLAMLKLLAQSQHSVKVGRYQPLKRVFADLAAKTKNLP
jgi:very-short-patch-repair endonuclease